MVGTVAAHVLFGKIRKQNELKVYRFILCEEDKKIQR